MTTPLHDFIPEHEVVCVVFFKYGIIFKPIYNTLVADTNLFFVVP